MNGKTTQEEVKGEIYSLSKDFKDLTLDSKREVLKTAKNLLKVQKSSLALITGNPPQFMETERQILV